VIGEQVVLAELYSSIVPVGHKDTIPLPRRPQQHRVPMEVEKPPLALGESADVDDSLRLDPHTLKRGPMRNRRHDKVAGILEADEAPIEQVVDARRQQQAILPKKPRNWRPSISLLNAALLNCILSLQVKEHEPARECW